MIPPFLFSRPPTISTQVLCASLLKLLTSFPLPILPLHFISAPPDMCPPRWLPTEDSHWLSETRTLSHKLTHHLTLGLQMAHEALLPGGQVNLLCLASKKFWAPDTPLFQGSLSWIYYSMFHFSQSGPHTMSQKSLCIPTPCFCLPYWA